MRGFRKGERRKEKGERRKEKGERRKEKGERRNRMNWYEIGVILLGGGGVASSLLALYNAKSNKTTVDISNLRALIEEERKERQELARELAEYKVEARGEISSLRHRLTQTTEAIYMAYRCRFPDTMVDCPVIRAYESCTRCERKEQDPPRP